MNRNHRNLVAWQKAMDLVEMVYRITADFPREERFGLVSQMRRAAVSVPANLAEGSARNSTRELLQFLGVASGSLSELDTHIAIAARVGLLSDPLPLEEKLAEVFKLLTGLQASVRRKL